jgi:hypothetical protein
VAFFLSQEFPMCLQFPEVESVIRINVPLKEVEMLYLTKATYLSSKKKRVGFPPDVSEKKLSG